MVGLALPSNHCYALGIWLERKNQHSVLHISYDVYSKSPILS